MIFPEYTAEEWLNKHPKPSMPECQCEVCGHTIIANKPYVEKGIVGFIALHCPNCSQNKQVPRSMKFTDKNHF